MPKPKPNSPAGTTRRRHANAVHQNIQEALVVLGIRDIDEAVLDELLRWAAAESPSYSQLIERLLGTAAGKKRERRIEARFRQSGLQERRTLEEFNWDFPHKINRATIEELATCDFVNRIDDVIFTGTRGTGKSHLLKAITLRACRDSSVRYARFADLISYFYGGLADGTYERRLARWARVPLAVIDDVGMGQVKRRGDEPTAAHMLYHLVDCRYQQASIMLSTNISLGEWGTYLGDATVAAAILDRLVERAVRIHIEGESYRQHRARERAQAGGESSQTPPPSPTQPDPEEAP
jgi:DNA replication protein DnaC